jgi:hypothetical protein
MPTPSSEIDISLCAIFFLSGTEGDGVNFFNSPVYESTSNLVIHSPSLWVFNPTIFLSAIYP